MIAQLYLIKLINLDKWKTMKKSLYNLLSMIPIYGTFLKFSSKGEMRLCSLLQQDFLDEGINPNDIFLLLEKNPDEVVTRDRLYEDYREILESLNKG